MTTSNATSPDPPIPTKALPSFWRASWLLFMQPLLLKDQLEQAGLAPNQSLIGCWRKRDKPPNSQALVLYILLIAAWTPLFLYAGLLLLQLSGRSVSYILVLYPGRVVASLICLCLFGWIHSSFPVSILSAIAMGSSMGIMQGLFSNDDFMIHYKNMESK